MPIPSPHLGQKMAAIYRELTRQGMSPDDAARAATGRSAVRTSGLKLPASGFAAMTSPDVVNHVERLFDVEVWKRTKAGLPRGGLKPREL